MRFHEQSRCKLVIVIPAQAGIQPTSKPLDARRRERDALYSLYIDFLNPCIHAAGI
jgi:hypothetical protein